MSEAELDPLVIAILRELAQAPGEVGVSLPRLGKRLGQGVSVLMRWLTLMGSATLGEQPGPGWVQVTRLEDRWVAALTDEGRRFCIEHLRAG